MKKIVLAFLLVGILTSCGDKKKDYLVKIKTSYGDMTVLLYDETPLHKKNFLELAKSGRYDSTIFHRVMQNFMIQGGNIYKKEGTVESEESRIPAEIVDGFYHTKGALAAARQPDASNPDKFSSSSQFYIVDGIPWDVMTTNVRLLNTRITELLQSSEYQELMKEFQDLGRKQDVLGMNKLALENKELVEKKFGLDLTIDPKTGNNEAYEKAGGGSPHLDGEYTIFGRVVEGIEVIDKIAAVRVGMGDQSKNQPIVPIFMSMEVITMSKNDVTDDYGYEYPNSKVDDGKE